MSTRLVRTALPAALVAGALVPASPAAAAYAPRLLVAPTVTIPATGGGTSAAAGVTVELRTAAGDDATARFVLFLPRGYGTGRPAAGEQLGSASATAVTPSGATVVLGGTVTSATADDASTACAPGGSAVWLLQLARAGALVRIPLVVADAPPAAASFAAATVTGCIPAASAATGGLRILSATLALGPAAVTQPGAAGTYRWRAQLTPFAAGSPGENAAGAVEAQSLVRLPSRLTASAKLVVQRAPVDVRVTRTIGGKAVTAVERRVRVTRFADVRGRVVGPDAGPGDTDLSVLGGTSAAALRRLVRVAPADGGSWSTRIQLDTAAPTVYFQATLAVPSRDLGSAACTPTFGASVPCVSASEAALRLASTVVQLATGR